MNINFFIPTKVIMEDNCIQRNVALFQDMGERALIVTGAYSGKQSGALSDVIDALTMAGKQYVLYDKVMNNPTVASVYEGAALAKRNKVDFVIGIGGGSPMDAAKAIALLATQEIPEDELFKGRFQKEALPMIMVPTTAGTGSEVTPYAVLTNIRLQTKTSISTPLIFPKYALLDAKYMLNLPMDITINTALDALSHAIEGMLSARATDISDLIATESIRKLTGVMKYLLPENSKETGGKLSKEVREKLLYGSMLAGMVIAHTGTTAVHSMGYSLTYFKDIPHGRANAVLLPSFLRYVAKSDPESIRKILSATEYKSLDEFETQILLLLGTLETITQEEVEKYASIAIQAKNIQNSKIVPDKEALISIYMRSLQIIL